MKNSVVSVLVEYKKQTIPVDELERIIRQKEGDAYRYPTFAQTIEELCGEDALSPIVASKLNGRNPALYNRYRKKTMRLTPEQQREIMCYHPKITTHRLVKNPEAFFTYQPYLRTLSSFLFRPDTEKLLTTWLTVNERSFQIFLQEKFLDAHPNFLALIGLTCADLHCYPTYEPFFYHDFSKVVPEGAILIVENKDTFDSIRKSFVEKKPHLHKIRFSYLVYGEGWKITRSIDFLTSLVKNPVAYTLYYFGDLDKTGIEIAGQLQKDHPDWTIKPFVPLYLELLRRYAKQAPQQKPQRGKYIDEFLGYFLPADAQEIQSLLENSQYIPQEGLTYAYFQEVLTDV